MPTGRAAQIARRLPTGLLGGTVLLILAAGKLERPGFWADESSTAWIAGRPLHQLLRVVVAEEANMGPYYLLVNGWLRLGDSDAWLRALSVPFGVAAVLLTSAAVHRWTRRRGLAVAAGVALALAPMMRHFTVEARGYSMVVAAAALALFAIDPRGERVRVDPVLLGIGVGLATAVNITAITCVAAPLTLVVASSALRENLRRIAQAVGVGLLIVAPFIPAYATNPTQIDWVTRQSFGLMYRTSVYGRMTVTPFVWGSVAVCLVVGVTAVLAARHSRERSDSAILTVAAGVGGLTPHLGLIIGTAVLQPMFEPRYAIAALPSMAVCVVLGPWTLVLLASRRDEERSRRVGLASAFAAVVVLGALSLSLRGPWEDRRLSDDTRAASAAITTRAEPGETLVLMNRWYWWFLSRYGVGDEGLQVIAAPNDLGTLDETDAIDALDDVEVDVRRPIWWVVRGGELPPPELARFRLQVALRMDETVESFGTIQVFRYTPRR